MRVQVARREYDGRCLLCGERDRVALECHRIEAGSRYTWGGTVTLCGNCHARVHAGAVRVVRWTATTRGEPVLHVEESGVPRFIRGWG